MRKIFSITLQCCPSLLLEYLYDIFRNMNNKIENTESFMIYQLFSDCIRCPWRRSLLKEQKIGRISADNDGDPALLMYEPDGTRLSICRHGAIACYFMSSGYCASSHESISCRSVSLGIIKSILSLLFLWIAMELAKMSSLSQAANGKKSYPMDAMKS